MAEKDDKDLDLDTDNAGKSKTNLLIIILIVVILAVGGGVAAMFLLGGDEEAGDGASAEGGDAVTAPVVKAPPIFSTMRPTFILNFEDTTSARYMQVDISIMSRSQASIDLAQENSPVIRNNIITILGGQTFEELNTRKGKEKLQKRILISINNTIKAEVMNSPPPAEEEAADENAAAVQAPGASYIEAVYFTSFVMQ